MPYLQSNQEVRENEVFNKALLAGAVIVGAAAAGQGVVKGIAEKWGRRKSSALVDETALLKRLYGEENISKMSAKYRSNNSPFFKTGNESARVLHADNNVSKVVYDKNKDRFINEGRNNITNWLSGGKAPKWMPGQDKELSLLNKRYKQYGKGKYKYGAHNTKLGIYQDLANHADFNGLNMNSEDIVQATEKVYNSDGMARARQSFHAINGGDNVIDDEINLMNEIWGTGPTRGEKATYDAEIKAEALRRSKGSTIDTSLRDTIDRNIGVGTSRDYTSSSGFKESFKNQNDYKNWWNNSMANDREYSQWWDNQLSNPSSMSKRNPTDYSQFMKPNVNAKDMLIKHRSNQRSARRLRAKENAANRQFADAILKSSGTMKVEGIDF